MRKFVAFTVAFLFSFSSHAGQENHPLVAQLRVWVKQLNGAKSAESFFKANSAFMPSNWNAFFVAESKKLESHPISAKFEPPYSLVLRAGPEIVKMEFGKEFGESISINGKGYQFESYENPEDLWAEMRKHAMAGKSAGVLEQIFLPTANAAGPIAYLVVWLATAGIGYMGYGLTACVFLDTHLEACKAQSPSAKHQSMIKDVPSKLKFFGYSGAIESCKDPKGVKTFSQLSQCMKEKYSVVLVPPGTQTESNR